MLSPHSTEPPTVSILILNWNGATVLPRCLEAVAAQTFDSYEVIVVDNASSDDSAIGLEARWPGVRVLRLERNLGFAAGNNHGARLARGRWLATINNDAFPHPGWLTCLVQAAVSNPGYSFFSSRMLQAADPSRVDGTGDVLHVSGVAWHRDGNQPAESAAMQAGEVFSPCAGAALYDRAEFLAAGGFDEQYANHHEDIDLGFRLRLRGGRCLYVPGAVVEHVGAASFGIESDRAVYHLHRNRVWTYFKNMPGWLVWKYLPAHLLANLVFLAYYTRRGQASAIGRAQWDALRGLPSILRKRKAIQRERQVSPGEIDRLLDHSLLGPYTRGGRAGRIHRIARFLHLER